MQRTDVVCAEALPQQCEIHALDALHLATALEIHDELDGLVTYDDRMAAAAEALGLPVLAPR